MRSASSASVTRRTAACVPSLWMSQRAKCSSGAAFMTISGGWMMGPAFISAAESASPQGSMTPGNAAPITSSAWPARRAGNTPVGSRLARMVMATSKGPCLRVSQGSVPVSAKATSARLPASRAREREHHRAERAGRQEHHLPVNQVRRQCPGDVGLRRRGRGAQDQGRVAHRFGDVGGDESRARLVTAPEVLDDDGPAGRPMRLDRRANRAATAAPRAPPAPDRRQPRTSHCHRPARRSACVSLTRSTPPHRERCSDRWRPRPCRCSGPSTAC